MAGLIFVPILLGIIIYQESGMKQAIGAEVITLVLYYCIVGASEEVFFRGYIYTTLSENIKNSKLTILLAAVVFALFHFISPEFNLMNFILLTIFGCIFIMMYQMIGSLWPLIVWHALWNTVIEYNTHYEEVIVFILSYVILFVVLKKVCNQ